MLPSYKLRPFAPLAESNMSDSKVLLTGATGFLGRHIIASLTERNAKVVALVRRRSEWNRQDWTAPYPTVDLIEGGITGSEGWTGDRRLLGTTGIIHTAAIVRHSRRSPEDIYETNVEGTLRMVRLAAKLGARLVFVSTAGTVACFRSPAQRADEDADYVDRVVRDWPYYDSKVKAERAARALATQLGVQLTIIRPPILLGPGDHRFRSTSYVLKFLRKKFPFVIEGGMSFIDVRDAAPAIVAALDHPAARPVYHLDGENVTVPEFFELCRQVSGVAAPARVMPYGTAHALAKTVESAAHLLGKHSPLPDPVVIEMGSHYWGIKSRYSGPELGYQPRPGRQTLADTVAWLRANHPALQGKGV